VSRITFGREFLRCRSIEAIPRFTRISLDFLELK